MACQICIEQRKANEEMSQKLKSRQGEHRMNKDHEKGKELLLYLVGKLRKIIL